MQADPRPRHEGEAKLGSQNYFGATTIGKPRWEAKLGSQGGNFDADQTFSIFIARGKNPFKQNEIQLKFEYMVKFYFLLFLEILKKKPKNAFFLTCSILN